VQATARLRPDRSSKIYTDAETERQRDRETENQIMAPGRIAGAVAHALGQDCKWRSEPLILPCASQVKLASANDSQEQRVTRFVAVLAERFARGSAALE
jgi:hypothetical protein